MRRAASGRVDSRASAASSDVCTVRREPRFRTRSDGTRRPPYNCDCIHERNRQNEEVRKRGRVHYVLSSFSCWSSAIVIYGKRRPPWARPLTWGEAMVAADLRLLRDVLGLRRRPPPVAGLGRQRARLAHRQASGRAELHRPLESLRVAAPVHVTYQTLRDIIVVGIYVVFLGLNIFDCGVVAGPRARRSRVELAKSDLRPSAGARKAAEPWPAPTPTRRCQSSGTTTSCKRSTPTGSPRRSSRSSSSTSTSPSASCARAASTSARGSASTW